MRRSILLLCCLLLAACAQEPLVIVPPRVPLEDARFAPPSEVPDATRVFALSDEMKRYAHEVLAPRLHRNGRRGVITTLYQRRGLQLEYDATRTRNATEAFDARRGNCLSLVIMTAAFADALDIPVTFQSAVIDDSWSREGSLYFAVGHVNLVLARHDRSSFRTLYDEQQHLVVDFLPAAEISGLQTRAITRARIVAMYMNNRAAEALARSQVDDAYWWAREAVRQDDTFLPAYNTLGVVYQHRGLLDAAQQAYSQVLVQSPRNVQALANEVSVLHQLHRDAEAEPLAQLLAHLEPYPPFYFFDQGLRAMQHQDYALAKQNFEKELKRTGDYHEFHFWLSVADYQLGDFPAARREMEAAIASSTRRSDHDLYAAKLERLDAYRRQ
jgi:Tfp pilus assembly protein PilF